MKTYQKLILFVAIVAAAAFGFSAMNKESAPLCRQGWKYHGYGDWKEGATIRHTFGKPTVLMTRRCYKCGHIQTKDSN